jgi:L-lactate dehydrogenase complex protein LldE
MTRLRVGLFATCLVDLMRPSVGFAAAALIERAGFSVHVPAAQTCCGQPAYNASDLTHSRKIAKQVVATFEGYDYVVTPSGSCGGMLKKHFLELFADDPDWKRRAEALAAKTFELTQFLDQHGGDSPEPPAWSARPAGPAVATYHDSCAGLRELGIRAQPRRLLAKVRGLALKEGKNAETCCGFGGLFCLKYAEISEKIVTDKVADLTATGATLIVGGDLGCLLNIAGRLKRLGHDTEVRHIAEVLAGDTETPGI